MAAKVWVSETSRNEGPICTNKFSHMLVFTHAPHNLLVIGGAIDFMCSIMREGLAPLGRPGCFKTLADLPPLSIALK